ncbi:MAG: hypothetical protein R3190_18555, partial [Thermoanaerobaculia bacterium]|nr:hypothetical protein [Thermoanaerobaculia bacterium]
MKTTLVPFVTLLALAVTAPGLAVGADDIPRTASGRPDLSGTYDIASLTPFQRDPRFGDRLFFTEEEAEGIAAQMANFRDALNRDSDPDREAPPAGGDGSGGPSGAVGGYNFFWIDNGTDTYKIDGKYRTSILTDPPNGRLPELSEAGKARRADDHPYSYPNPGRAWWLEKGEDPYDGPETLSLVDRCLYVVPASLPAQPVPYNNLKTIVQTDDQIVINIEWMHWARVIRMDPDGGKPEHLPAEIVSYGGDSVGWWEGDTLVVDTTNFRRQTHSTGEARARNERDGLHVVERFSRLDADTLLYQFTVNDPDYVAPYSGELPWDATDAKLYEYACHEGNYALGNILRGARL